MCGIVGVLGGGGDNKEEALKEMTDRLAHRGPDDAGVYVNGDVGLAHRRLSIIDLSDGGHQPMSTADGRYTIVFNGEIYNFKQLRERYCSWVTLRSQSDTEVLLNVLAQKGVNVLREIKGMFALALWDREKEELLLATDPFGKKPLYYYQDGEVFIFASEIKAILASGRVEAKVDRAALVKYLMYEYVPGNKTGYAGIAQMPMGSYMIIGHNRRGQLNSWWQPRWYPKQLGKTKDYVKEMDRLLRQAVQRRLVADVPVGVLLSGGLDSTTIAWYMRESGVKEIHSFSVSFTENSFDEAAFAQQAAAVIGCEHHNLVFSEDVFREYLNKLADNLDIPFSDSSFLPTWAVSDWARQRVKVVLDGDGSDELLGGYGVWRAAEVADKLPGLPRAWWRAAWRVAEKMPTGFDYFTFDFKAKTFLKGLGLDLPKRHQVWLGSFDDKQLEKILQRDVRKYIAEVFNETKREYDVNEDLDTFDLISKLTVRNYLHNDILVKLDRASMLASLEARTPFMDVDLAEFLLRLPSKYKRNKWILRRLMRGRIPDGIIDRPKQGFALPLGHWLRGSLHDWAKETLSPERLAAGGIVKPEVGEKLLSEHKRGKHDYRKQLWTLLMLVLWQERWIEGGLENLASQPGSTK